MVTVVLADDHAEARQGLRLLLESDPDFHIVGEAANGLESLRNQLRALASHLLEARESERPTLARELHDEFGQVLTSLQLQLA